MTKFISKSSSNGIVVPITSSDVPFLAQQNMFNPIAMIYFVISRPLPRIFNKWKQLYQQNRYWFHHNETTYHIIHSPFDWHIIVFSISRQLYLPVISAPVPSLVRLNNRHFLESNMSCGTPICSPNWTPWNKFLVN